VKLVLAVDLDGLSGDPAGEVRRILRYWGGAAAQIDWSRPLDQIVYDSGYREVGRLRVTADQD
jgi:hypothetical protein